MSAGVVPTHKGRESGAAYGSTVLQPRVVGTGSVKMPHRPYKWRDPDRIMPLRRIDTSRVSRNP